MEEGRDRDRNFRKGDKGVEQGYPFLFCTSTYRTKLATHLEGGRGGGANSQAKPAALYRSLREAALLRRRRRRGKGHYIPLGQTPLLSSLRCCL